MILDSWSTQHRQSYSLADARKRNGLGNPREGMRNPREVADEATTLLCSQSYGTTFFLKSMKIMIILRLHWDWNSLLQIAPSFAFRYVLFDRCVERFRTPNLEFLPLTETIAHQSFDMHRFFKFWWADSKTSRCDRAGGCLMKLLALFEVYKTIIESHNLLYSCFFFIILLKMQNKTEQKSA